MRLSRCILLLPLLFSTVALFGQSKLDSLKDSLNVARRKNDRKGVASFLSKIGYHYNTSLQLYDSALYYYKASISPANFSTNDALNASTYNGIGSVYQRKAFPDSAIRYYSLALELYQKIKDIENSTAVKVNLSIIYKQIGQYDKGLEIALDALDHLEKKKPDNYLAICYNTIGSIYLKTNEYKNALIYYKKGLVVRKEIGYTKGVGISYTSIGEAFIYQHQYDSALANLLPAAKIKREANDKKSLAATLNLIGKAYLEKKEFSKSESYLMEALKIKKESGERSDVVDALNNLGELKLKQSNFAAAEQFLNEAETLARNIGMLDYIRQNFELKIQLLKKQGNLAKAMTYTDELLIIKDSLLNKEKTEALAALQTQYETEKKEQKIKILEGEKTLQQSEIKAKQFLIIGLAVGVVLAVIIGILIFFSLRQSVKNKRKVETLLKELNHRVKNNLQLLLSVLSLQSQHLTDDTAVQAMKSTESRMNAMMIIHKKLYGSNFELNIDIKEYLSELLKDLIHSYGYTQSLQLNFNCEELRIDVDEAIPIGLIVNELVSNALKHAFNTQQNPQLHVDLSRDGKGELKLAIRDNGNQAKRINLESPKSFGLKMVGTLIKELRGSLHLNYNNGSEFIIQVPIN